MLAGVKCCVMPSPPVLSCPLSSFICPTDVVSVLRLHHLMQPVGFVLFWSTGYESSFPQRSLRCTCTLTQTWQPCPVPPPSPPHPWINSVFVRGKWVGAQREGRFVLNEGDQADKEQQGQTNRVLEGGCWILMISLCGGEKGMWGMILLVPKMKGETDENWMGQGGNSG